MQIKKERWDLEFSNIIDDGIDDVINKYGIIVTIKVVINQINQVAFSTHSLSSLNLSVNAILLVWNYFNACKMQVRIS